MWKMHPRWLSFGPRTQVPWLSTRIRIPKISSSNSGIGRVNSSDRRWGRVLRNHVESRICPFFWILTTCACGQEPAAIRWDGQLTLTMPPIRRADVVQCLILLWNRLNSWSRHRAHRPVHLVFLTASGQEECLVGTQWHRSRDQRPLQQFRRRGVFLPVPPLRPTAVLLRERRMYRVQHQSGREERHGATCQCERRRMYGAVVDRWASRRQPFKGSCTHRRLRGHRPTRHTGILDRVCTSLWRLVIARRN